MSTTTASDLAGAVQDDDGDNKRKNLYQQRPPLISLSDYASSSKESARPFHVVFVHLDLGIGGAEQLITQLAVASVELGHDVDIVTTRCDPDHCFEAYKPPTAGHVGRGGGRLYSSLHVYGRWIPPDVMGYGRVFFSTVRLLYLAFKVAHKKGPDLYVVDVLPTPLAILNLTDTATLFYCHFPDKLLKKKQQQQPSILGRLYRGIMNSMEGWTMASADCVVVNSIFTRETVQRSFASLANAQLPVLYPALDGGSLDDKDTGLGDEQEYMIVSLNRYERKKNLELFLEMASWIRTNYPEIKLPRLVVAGGYDTQNVENVEYRSELGQLARKLRLNVDFKLSVSDAERSRLLRTALAVVYTPSHEHFGIVPLESMYASTPVIAVDSGGPKESIVNGQTGFLCESTPEGFGKALLELLRGYPTKSLQMGKAGRQHVVDKFGEERLKREWKILAEQALVQGRRRLARAGQYRLARSIIYSGEAIATLILAMLLTLVLRQVRLLQDNESAWHRGEL